MKQYRVFEHPSGSKEAVKQGWSWPALLFGVIWALIKKLWAIFGGMIGVLVLFFILPPGSGIDFICNLVGLAISIVFGLYGNSWREKNLVSRGFKPVAMVNAKNAEAAIASYLNGMDSAGAEQPSAS